MNSIKITVATPVYNREDCIGRCIESVINQRYNDIEHWIVDDGSTDHTFQIVERYAKQYPFIRCHTFDKNQGVNAARNYAIQHSSKDFVIFLDSDDHLVEGALTMINDKILAYPGYCHYLFAQNDRMSYYNQNQALSGEIVELTFADWLTEKISGDFAHVMVTPWVQMFPFDEHMRIYEGLNFMRIFKAGKKQLFIKEIVMNRERDRFDSVTKTTYLQNKDASYKQYLFLKEMLSLFEADYLKFQQNDKLAVMVNRIFMLGLALDKYEENKSIKLQAKEKHIKLPLIFRIMDYLHLGFILRNTIYVYSYIKTSIVKK
ncbi:MAG: 3-glucosyltransferase [Candidatus Ordinivivax streblomastigis]|uniref:3-glucosyltransferase n=1 Tax=Candidatus Ordinivivax streblomastigis TaxID=2540710 RepID=A0A5M8P1M0_9BACT|nr:MAG: 3-glucosyltransferase [Candidatus Ordinivivax streblomastigis]